MRMGWAVLAMVVAAMAGPAAADVKSGVQAWARKDYTAAVAQWRGPAAAGDADAQYNMAQAYKRGRGVTADPIQAEALYRKAAAQGQPQAQAALALMLYTGGARSDAMPWFEKAAAKGEPRAQYVLGTALFNGDGVTKDWPRAYALMSRAAAAGLTPARTSLTQMTSYLTAADRMKGTRLARAMPLGAKVDVAGKATKTDGIGKTAKAEVADKSVKPATDKSTRSAKEDAADKKTAGKTPPAKKGKEMAAAIAEAWRIQLGAFGQEKAAKAHWTKLATKKGLTDLAPVYVARGGMIRLQAGPLDDRAAATRACAVAAKAGSGCFAVSP